jgi:hypothetical protein
MDPAAQAGESHAVAALPPATPHMSLAQDALSRGLAALTALSADATEEQTATALLHASREISACVAEQQPADERASSAAPQSPLPAAGGAPAWQAFRGGQAGTPSERAVLQLFSRLESSDSELAAFRAQVRRGRARAPVRACARCACERLTYARVFPPHAADQRRCGALAAAATRAEWR